MDIQEEINRLQQIVLEDMYSRVNIRKHIKQEIMESCPNVMKQAVDLIADYVKTRYSYESKNKRIQHLDSGTMSYEEIALEVFVAVLPEDKVTRIQNIAAKIGIRLEYDDVFNGIKTASELLAILRHTKIFNIYKAGAFDTHMTIVSRYKLSKRTLEYLDRAMYLPPLVCVPNKWKKNHGGGYITTKQSLLLGRENHHNEQQNYDAINTLQDVELRLDPFVLTLKEKHTKKLDPEAKRQFDRQVALSKKIYKYYKDIPFHFAWRYDKRGRMYSQGYHINLQSYGYKKALINFAKEEYLI